MAFIHPRTGRSWANEAMAIRMDGPLVSPGPGLVQTGAFAGNLTGKIEQVQEGSQFWMNSAYAGPEPSLAVKAVFSTADYARDWIGEAARAITGPVSPAVQAIQKDYPVTNPELIKAVRETVESGPGPVQAAGGAELSALIAELKRLGKIVESGPGPVHEEPVSNYYYSGGAGTSGSGDAGTFDLSAALPYLAIGGIALLLLSGKKGIFS